jgi:hypothetical protein
MPQSNIFSKQISNLCLKEFPFGPAGSTAAKAEKQYQQELMAKNELLVEEIRAGARRFIG